MIDMTNGARSCVPVSHNHFNGNGNCDAMREANRRADRMTGMESEIAPYYGPAGAMPAGAGSGTTENGTTENGMTGDSAAEQQMAAANAAANRAAANAAANRASSTGAMSSLTPYGGTSAAAGYNDPEFGPDHDWTSEEEDGMNSLPQDSFDEPLSADEAARNSWRALLARNVGRNVLVQFLMGTQNMVTVEGELYEVGTDYIVIYQPLWDSHITADLYSVKFVEFREPPGAAMLN